MGVMELVVPALEGDVEGLGKAIAEVVGGGALQGLAVVHHGLDGVGGFSAGKLLLIGLAAADHRDCQVLFTHLGIHVPACWRVSALASSAVSCRVWPSCHQELHGTQERAGGLFPAHYRAPLVVELGQVAVGVYHMGKVIAEQGLGSGAHAQTLLKAAPHRRWSPRPLRGQSPLHGPSPSGAGSRG